VQSQGDDEAHGGADVRQLSGKAGWSDGLRIGRTDIDADHKAFFELSDMLECALNNEDIDTGFIDCVVEVLRQYVDGNFFREEVLMVDFKCQEWVQDHINRHNTFRRIVYGLARGAKRGSRASIATLSKVCKSWILEHIIAYDSKLRLMSNFRSPAQRQKVAEARVGIDLVIL